MAKSKPELLRRGLGGGWGWWPGEERRRTLGSLVEWLKQFSSSKLAVNACMVDKGGGLPNLRATPIGGGRWSSSLCGDHRDGWSV